MIKNNFIPLTEPYFDNVELEVLVKTIKSGWISSKGEFVSKFEQEFARYCNVKHGVSCSNGTAALHLALLAFGIKEGDEVIVPTLTFISPVNAVKYCGAKPILVDVNEQYWGINPGEIEKAITKKTRAIILVHLYGHPCDINLIINIAKKHNLYVIEDCAEAHGALYKGKRVGSFGDISCFSFFGNKHMTTGEGGMCITNSLDLKNKMNLLKNHGLVTENKRYWHEVIGYNYRMTNMQAAVGLAQLRKLNGFLRKKNKIANWYLSEFNDLIKKGIIAPHPKMPWAENSVWLYTILLNGKTEKERDEIIDKMNEKGIDTRPFFDSIHLMPPYKTKVNFPIAESISLKGISLPSSVKLMRGDVRRIAKVVRQLL